MSVDQLVADRIAAAAARRAAAKERRERIEAAAPHGGDRRSDQFRPNQISLKGREYGTS